MAGILIVFFFSARAGYHKLKSADWLMAFHGSAGGLPLARGGRLTDYISYTEYIIR